MYLLKLKSGQEIIISDLHFAKIQPALKSGANPKINIAGHEPFDLYEVIDYSKIDNSFVATLERYADGNKYIAENSRNLLMLPGANLKKKTWIEKQNRKLDIMKIPDDLREDAKKIVERFYPMWNGAGFAYLVSVKSRLKLKNLSPRKL